MRQTKTIQRIFLTKGQVDVWHEEGNNDEVKPDRSCKSKYLWDAIDKANAHNEIMNNGITGKKIEWENISGEYKIISIHE